MFHRRELLQIGCSSFFGVGLSALTSAGEASATAIPRVKSVVLLFLSGGGSHIDMFDPKPDVPEVKGEFAPINTSLAGVRFSGKMTGLASRAQKLAVVRAMAHGDTRHLSGSHNTLTGSVQPFRGTSNQAKSLNRADWPSYGSVVSYLRPRRDGLPSQITLPKALIEGTLVWPGQHAGFLGPRHDPFILSGDPNSKDYRPKSLSLVEGLSVRRVEDRRRLLKDLGEQQSALEQSRQGQKFGVEQERAFSMLTSSKLNIALDLSREPSKVRDRYGYGHTYGQTLLLARRLVEMEIPLIQCNMGHVQMWDTHVNHFGRLKTYLPALDQGLSALLDDLELRGLLDSTLVICVGEFGRTPKISPLPNQKTPGRHHWSRAYTAVFAGGGVRGGQVIGKTDRIGSDVVSRPFHPNDIGATIYSALGIDPSRMIPDREGRPIHLNRGTPMGVLYTG